MRARRELRAAVSPLLTNFIYHHTGEDDLTMGRIDVVRASVRPIVPQKSAVVAQRPARRSKLALPVKPILGGGILLLTASSAFLAMSYLHPFSRSSASPTATADRRSGSIVFLGGDPSTCHHLTFDNATGAVKDAGMGECVASLPGAAARLGEVSDSFSHGK
jgi:hypothetical protein